MQPHKIVSQSEWLAARKAFLENEKRFTRARDELSRQRRELPWVKVEKTYVFDGPDGKETLADLFDGRSQLIVYHFMFGPGWEQGCPSCSFLADHFDGAAVHLAQRDVTLLVGLARAACRDRGVQEAHGLALQVGVVVRQRLQSRLPRVVHARTRWRRARSTTTTTSASSRARKRPASACSSRTRPATSSTPIRPTRAGSTSWSAPTTSRPRAEGARRRRPGVHHGVGAPPRPLRERRSRGSHGRISGAENHGLVLRLSRHPQLIVSHQP